MKRFLSLLLLSIALRLSASDFDPYEGPKTILVFTQSIPWTDWVGLDDPRVVLYEDGTLIYYRELDDGVAYRKKLLSPAQLSEFKQHLAPVTRLKNLKPNYEMTAVSDQPYSQFYIENGNSPQTFNIYGLGANTKSIAAAVPLGNHKLEKPPKELLHLHKYLCSLNFPDSTEFVPKYVEVVVWPSPNASGKSLAWPKVWPALDSERSFKHRNSYSIFLGGGLLPELKKYLEMEKTGGCVEISGKKWRMVAERVFPGESAWRNAFERSDK